MLARRSKYSSEFGVPRGAAWRAVRRRTQFSVIFSHPLTTSHGPPKKTFSSGQRCGGGHMHPCRTSGSMFYCLARDRCMMHDTRWPHVPVCTNVIQSRQVDRRLLVCTIVFSYGCLISVRMEEMN